MALKDLGQTMATLTGGTDELYKVMGGSININAATQIMDLWTRANVQGEVALQGHRKEINSLALGLLTTDIEYLIPKLKELNLLIADTGAGGGGGGGFGGVAESAEFATTKILNMTDAAEQFKATMAGIAGTDFGRASALPLTPTATTHHPCRAGQSNVDSLMEELRLNTEEQRRQLIERGRANEELAPENNPGWPRHGADDTRSAWKEAAGVETAWKNAVGGTPGIPGVTGRSEVTELDTRLAQYGLYQNKPDEFLRQAEDQLLNGVDRGISRNLLTSLTAEHRASIWARCNAGCPTTCWPNCFGQEYESGSIFDPR